MNLVDVILIIVLLLSIVSSVRQGFILSMLDLLCWLGSLMLAFLIYSSLAGWFDTYFPSIGIWSAPLAFITVLLTSRVILDSLAYRSLLNIPKSRHTNLFNKLLGIFPGIVNGFLWIVVLSSLLLLLPISSNFSEDSRNSKLSGWAVDRISWVEDRLSPVFSELFNRIVPKPSAAIGEQKSIKLPFTVTDPTPRKDLEAEMLVMVNQEREKHGLKALRADPVMAVVARKHAADMFARGFFSHISPDGINPFQRIRKEKIPFIIAGENLALAQTLAIAHTGLMNSPGHRANILRAQFGRLGIGILDGGIYGLMITQNFRN